MQSNHTLLTIGAFIILATVLQGFYRILWTASDDVADAQDMILATTIATSYLEMAQGLAFDEITDTSHVGMNNASLLTPVSSLGRDGKADDSIAAFNDFDDFNGTVVEKQATGTNKRFTTAFRVHYVNPNNVDMISTTPTFLKRLDLVAWRSYPPQTGTAMDTLRLSVTLGYFHFD